MLNLGLSLWFGLLENSRPPACYFQGNSWVLCYSIWIIGKSFKIFHTFNIKTPWNVRENSKKHSVDIIVGLYTLRRKCSSCNLIFPQLPQLKKRPSRKHSKASALPRLQKPFTRWPFFNFGNFGKIKLHLEYFSLEFAQLW